MLPFIETDQAEVDRAPEVLFGVGQEGADLEQIDIADDEQVDVACGPFSAARHRTENERSLDLVGHGAESFPKPVVTP